MDGFAVTEAPGQEDLFKQFSRDIAHNRIAHSLLLVGRRGTGKRTLAAFIARALLCTGEQPPCNRCHACKALEHGNHPDAVWVTPSGKTFRVEEVYEIQQALALRPFKGGRRVVVVEDAHTMNAPAQNKLLKTLEEPPAGSILVLLAEKTASLLPTVLSRCRIVRMQAVPVQRMADILRGNGCSAEKAWHVAAMSDGSLGKAKELMDDEAYFALRDRAAEALLAIREKEGVFPAMALLRERKDQIAGVLSVWQTLLRDGLLYSQGIAAFHADHTDWVEKIAGLGKFRLEKMLMSVLEAEFQLSCNTQTALLCDVLTMGLQGEKDRA